MSRQLARTNAFEFPTVDRFLSRMFDEPIFGLRPSSLMQSIDEGPLPLDISEDDNAVIVRATPAGAMLQPMRHPVIANDLATPSTTINRS